MDADQINQIVADYETLRTHVFEAIKPDSKNLLGWLSTAFRNEGDDGIKGITAHKDGIDVWGRCWTSQTGGSYEHWELVLAYEALSAVEAKCP